jgi:adenine-specific DNA-methyltransferase
VQQDAVSLEMPPKKKKPVEKPTKTNSGRFTDLTEVKLRGGYYTSPELAEWLCAWAIRSPKDRVLEPSCGDGAFLEAALKQYKSLGVRAPAIARQLTGVEINSAEAVRALERLRPSLSKRALEVVVEGDFFTWWKGNRELDFNAVVGNPPFIRYQTFPEPHRSLAMALMAEQGLVPNRLTNIWVPFVVAAVASLRIGGRLALVLPAELLQVTYAAQLRSFLTDRFERIDIVACNELFFGNAQQEVVLLLAEGLVEPASDVNLCRVAMTEVRTAVEVTSRSPSTVIKKAQPKIIHHDSEKWLKYFLSNREIGFMRALRAGDVATSLSTHAEVDVGVVTGKNEFFVLTSSQVEELGLDKYTTPLVSRSAHLKGARVRKADWKAMAAAGDRVHLLDLKSYRGKLSAALARYIRIGEGRAVHKGFKCSIRDPWYAVPSVWTPDGFLFRQIYDFPRVVLNQTDATSTDTIHRFTSKIEKPERVIANTYTWLTAASAEIEGRSYGGGVLELEPTEAERLLVPTALNGALPLSECDKLTRAGHIDQVLEENGRIVLMEHMGLSKSECSVLRGIWTKMRNRRNARKRGRSSSRAKCPVPAIHVSIHAPVRGRPDAAVGL